MSVIFSEIVERESQGFEPADAEIRKAFRLWLRIWHNQPQRKQDAWRLLPRAEREATKQMDADEFAVFMADLELTPELVAAKEVRQADYDARFRKIFPVGEPLMTAEVLAFDLAVQRTIDEICREVPADIYP